MGTCKITYNGNEISSVDEAAPVSVAYNSATIATLNDGDTKTLGCHGKVMASDVVIGSKTLNCNGKLMRGDIVVALSATTVDAIFANNSWDAIIAACQSGSVPDSWAVGDSKTMTINGTDYQIDIIGKNHDTYTAGGTAPLTFQMHDCYATKYVMDDSTVSEYIWESSAIRTIYLPAIAAMMPSEVQDGIKEVEKKTAVGTMGNNVINTIAESLFLLSEIEVFGSVSQSNSGEGKQYSYYSAGGSKIKNLGGSAIIWGERSPCAYSKTANCVVGTNGQQLSGDLGYQRGVAFAFCF